MSLSVRQLSKSHVQAGRHINVLQGLELEVKGGETVAIIGKSGSGKSTLLALLAGLDNPDQGQVVLNGEALTGQSETALARLRARSMGIIFQQFQLVQTLTALENVMLPAEILGDHGQEARARELLEAVGLRERLHHFPAQLSGGEQQRVAIARALAGTPQLILADEPTGNLDNETGQQVMDLLFGLLKQKGIALVLVTHDPECAARCERILTLQSGKLHS